MIKEKITLSNGKVTIIPDHDNVANDHGVWILNNIIEIDDSLDVEYEMEKVLVAMQFYWYESLPIEIEKVRKWHLQNSNHIRSIRPRFLSNIEYSKKSDIIGKACIHYSEQSDKTDFYNPVFPKIESFLTSLYKTGYSDKLFEIFKKYMILKYIPESAGHLWDPSSFKMHTLHSLIDSYIPNYRVITKNGKERKSYFKEKYRKKLVEFQTTDTMSKYLLDVVLCISPIRNNYEHESKVYEVWKEIIQRAKDGLISMTHEKMKEENKLVLMYSPLFDNALKYIIYKDIECRLTNA